MQIIIKRYGCSTWNIDAKIISREIILLKGVHMEEKMMKKAIKESLKAFKNNEMPIGAVIVLNGKVISSAYNKKEMKKDPTMHAEIIAIKKAAKKIGDWRLNKCSIYATMEPCPMCMGAIKEARLEKIYCGIRNEKSHFKGEGIAEMLNLDIEYGILAAEISQIIKNFFNSIRNR